MNREEIIEHVNSKNNLKSHDSHIYYLTHTYDAQMRKIWVKAPYNHETFVVICAYIQYECSDIEMGYSMDQTDVLKVLEKYYDCTGDFSIMKEDKKKAKEVDLYLNWEVFCGCAGEIENMESLHRKGMNELLERFVELFYQSHPNWRRA